MIKMDDKCMKKCIKGKIKTREEIREIVSMLKAEGKTIVSANGSFDLLHAGHLKFLEEGKAQGDIFIIGLNSDESVRGWKKLMKYNDWNKRPIIPQQYRALMLAATVYVDYVTIFDEIDCLKFVESVKPHVHVNGSEYGEECIEAQVVRKYGGRVHIVKKEEGLSTSEIIRKIISISTGSGNQA